MRLGTWFGYPGGTPRTRGGRSPPRAPSADSGLDERSRSIRSPSVSMAASRAFAAEAGTRRTARTPNTGASGSCAALGPESPHRARPHPSPAEEGTPRRGAERGSPRPVRPALVLGDSRRRGGEPSAGEACPTIRGAPPGASRCPRSHSAPKARGRAVGPRPCLAPPHLPRAARLAPVHRRVARPMRPHCPSPRSSPGSSRENGVEGPCLRAARSRYGRRNQTQLGPFAARARPSVRPPRSPRPRAGGSAAGRGCPRSRAGAEGGVPSIREHREPSRAVREGYRSCSETTTRRRGAQRAADAARPGRRRGSRASRTGRPRGRGRAPRRGRGRD